MKYNRVIVTYVRPSVRDIAEAINTLAMGNGRAGAFVGDDKALRDSIDFVQSEINKVHEQDRPHLVLTVETEELED